jgi:hypothetical protein
MLLRLTAPVADWARMATALDAVGSPVLAGTVRAQLNDGPRSDSTESVPLTVTPAETAALQRVAAALGMHLPAAIAAAEPDAADWVAPEAERQAAAAAADAIVRAHQRRHAA